MVSCKHCLTQNSLDSTFCRRCGTALPEDEILAAKEKLDVLIGQGNTSFNEGRTDEALAVADTALLSNPTSTTALSLKSLCHERRGELAEALECADQIVELNPDSELDKIKRNQLRSKLAISVQLATQPPDKRPALIGAVAAVVLVICVGIAAAKLLNRTEQVKTSQPLVRSETPIQKTQSPANTQTASQNSANVVPNNQSL